MPTSPTFRQSLFPTEGSASCTSAFNIGSFLFLLKRGLALKAGLVGRARAFSPELLLLRLCYYFLWVQPASSPGGKLIVSAHVEQRPQQVHGCGKIKATQWGCVGRGCRLIHSPPLHTLFQTATQEPLCSVCLALWVAWLILRHSCSVCFFGGKAWA